MHLLKRYKSLFDDYLMTDHHNRMTISILCKSLYVFLLFKLFFIRGILVERLQDSFFSGLNDIAVYGFIAVVVSVLLVSLFLKVNYVSGFFIFIASFGISRAMVVVANGSDFVLNLFLFFSIFLSASPRFKNPLLAEGQLAFRNFFFLICQIQLALIYLLSGFDKLTSEAWRSGGAIFSILNLDFFFNPLISVTLGKTACLIIAWATIVFELSFALLIWVRKFRLVLLCLGVIFHLGIIFLLSLPDFGILMILLYSLFLPYEKLGKQPMVATSGGS